MAIQWELGEILVIELSRQHFGNQGGLATWQLGWRPFLASSRPYGFFYKLVEIPTNFTIYDASGSFSLLSHRGCINLFNSSAISTAGQRDASTDFMWISLST
ncbi:hypothetical protein TNCV_5141521 [Trichonephila clavipes]|nr:hypothetical protein TNCV_5141521 [Trichonephila clavipes]